MVTLNNAESQVLSCIEEFSKRNGFSPTVREIQQALGYRSTSTVHRYIKQLAASGLISYEPAKPRTMVVLVSD